MAKEVAAVVAAAAESRGIGYQGQLVRVSGGRRCAAKEPARAGLVASLRFCLTSHLTPAFDPFTVHHSPGNFPVT